MIKKVTFIAIILSAFIASSAFAQVKIVPDSRLYQCFSKEYIQEVQLNNPKLLAYYNFYLDNSYFISKTNSTKKMDIPSISNVKYKESDKQFDENIKDFSMKTFNPLKYDFKIEKNVYSHYSLGNGDVIVFYPLKRFMKKYNEYIIELGL